MKNSETLEQYYFVDENEDIFYCKPKGKKLPLEKCLVDYLNHNAFEKRRSRCYRCRIGRKNREGFSES